MKKLHLSIGDPVEYELTRRQCLEAHQKHFEKLRKEFGCCKKCNRKNKLTLDHIIPKIILVDMGYDTQRFFDREDLQLLCRPCNAFKTGRLDFSNPETKRLLIKYLRRL